MANRPTSPTSAQELLAQKHLRANARSSKRSLRQYVRLQMLQRWARRYRLGTIPPRGIQAAGQSVSLPGDIPTRLLVIRPDHLGDLLFATPALRLLRRSYPDAQISALVGPWGQAVLAGNRDVDQVLTCNYPGFSRQPKAGLLAPYRLLQAEAGRLREHAFDLALVLRFDHWWGAWLAAAAGIPRRLGYALPEVAPFLTQELRYQPGRHEVVQNLVLVLAAAEQEHSPGLPAVVADDQGHWRLQFAENTADRALAQELLAPLDTGRRWVAIHPGSGAAVKHWRAEAWAELAGRLSGELDVQVLFTGVASESGLVEAIMDVLGRSDRLVPAPLSLIGRTTLGSLAAVYRCCSLVIGPDSGPLHLAVAVHTPTVHLYGPVDRRTFGPWGNPQRHRVVTSSWACAPCNRLDWAGGQLAEHGCLRDVGVNQVWEEVVELLG